MLLILQSQFCDRTQVISERKYHRSRLYTCWLYLTWCTNYQYYNTEQIDRLSYYFNIYSAYMRYKFLLKKFAKISYSITSHLTPLSHFCCFNMYQIIIQREELVVIYEFEGDLMRLSFYRFLKEPYPITTTKIACCYQWLIFIWHIWLFTSLHQIEQQEASAKLSCTYYQVYIEFISRLSTVFQHDIAIICSTTILRIMTRTDN